MSKQSDAKDSQGFRKKPQWPTCGNCKEFTFDEVRKESYGDIWHVETSLRCKIGGFKVGKTDTCNMHKPAE
jgi:hypothetical protein